MNDTVVPRIYLALPPQIDRQTAPAQLADWLDRFDIACVRLATGGLDEAEITRNADALREVASARDIALVLDSHFRLAARLGLDGCHLTDGAKNYREARKALGDGGIVGVYCGASRHAGMSAAEMGADYVAFGPITDTGLGDGRIAGADLFRWWSETIEVPVVAERGIDPAAAKWLRDAADFVTLGPEIWARTDAGAEMAALCATIGAGDQA